MATTHCAQPTAARGLAGHAKRAIVSFLRWFWTDPPSASALSCGWCPRECPAPTPHYPSPHSYDPAPIPGHLPCSWRSINLQRLYNRLKDVACFPCLPSSPQARFAVSMEVPAAYIALSNMPSAAVVNDTALDGSAAPGRTTYHFQVGGAGKQSAREVVGKVSKERK